MKEGTYLSVLMNGAYFSPLSRFRKLGSAVYLIASIHGSDDKRGCSLHSGCHAKMID